MLLPMLVGLSAVLSSAEEKKKCKYLSAAELHHAFVVSVDGHGALGHVRTLL